jgi:hypothetical protein
MAETRMQVREPLNLEQFMPPRHPILWHAKNAVMRHVTHCLKKLRENLAETRLS